MHRRPTIAVCAVVVVLAAVVALLARHAEQPAAADARAAVTATSVPTPAPSTVPSPPVVTTPTSPAASTAPSTAPTTPIAGGMPDPVGEVTGPAGACPGDGHGAVVDRAGQRAWLCDGATLAAELPITSAWTMPDAGTYAVYAKDLKAWSTFGGHASTMTHFVAFARGERTGARIAFHSVPTLADGAYAQPLQSVGDPSRRGESSGCIRLLPEDSVRVWDWLSIGDQVRVVS
jgi:hypothetical protein